MHCGRQVAAPTESKNGFILTFVGCDAHIAPLLRREQAPALRVIPFASLVKGGGPPQVAEGLCGFISS